MRGKTESWMMGGGLCVGWAVGEWWVEGLRGVGRLLYGIFKSR